MKETIQIPVSENPKRGKIAAPAMTKTVLMPARTKAKQFLFLIVL